ncbi:unnamed protein product [Laminaria digitata]
MALAIHQCFLYGICYPSLLMPPLPASHLTSGVVCTLRERFYRIDHRTDWTPTTRERHACPPTHPPSISLFERSISYAPHSRNDGNMKPRVCPLLFLLLLLLPLFLEVVAMVAVVAAEVADSNGRLKLHCLLLRFSPKVGPHGAVR